MESSISTARARSLQEPFTIRKDFFSHSGCKLHVSDGKIQIELRYTVKRPLKYLPKSTDRSKYRNHVSFYSLAELKCDFSPNPEAQMAIKQAAQVQPPPTLNLSTELLPCNVFYTASVRVIKGKEVFYGHVITKVGFDLINQEPQKAVEFILHIATCVRQANEAKAQAIAAFRASVE